MKEEQYILFLEKYAHGLHTPYEHEIFLEWFHALPEIEARNVMQQFEKISSASSPFERVELDSLRSKIEASLDMVDIEQDVPKERKINWGVAIRVAAAAVIVLVGAYGFYRTSRAGKSAENIVSEAVVKDIEPGGNKAILTLADGSKINLNDAGQGKIASQAGISIAKLTDGELTYTKAIEANGIKTNADMNLVSTPRAGQYRISLSDGTKVWLNSMSSIRFPAMFDGNSRHVKITGEAYFEVASQYRDGKKVPFLVSCNNQLIEVVGTHFNVNSYQDEGAVKTTLLEGSVKVSVLGNKTGLPESTVKLSPGEQSVVKQSGSKMAPILVGKADTEIAIAWKEGYFKFDNTDIQEVMKQLSRWYDLQIVYAGTMPKDQFTGYVSKNVSISNILNILEEGGGVKFDVKGKRVEVSSID